MVFPLSACVAETFCIISVSGVIPSSAFLHRAKLLFSTECYVGVITLSVRIELQLLALSLALTNANYYVYFWICTH